MRTGFLLLAALLVTACVDVDAVSVEEERDLVEERQSELFEAMAAKDAEATANVFSETAVLHVASMPPVEGRSAIQEFYGNMFGFLSASRATPEHTHVSASGDLAYSIGHSSNEFGGPEGTIEYEGKYVIVWEKPAEEWLIAVYSISSNEREAGR